jgi:hypothetical protein
MGLCDFASAGFGNNVKYQLNDAYVGPDTSSGVGKLAGKPGCICIGIVYRLLKAPLRTHCHKHYFNRNGILITEFNKSEFKVMYKN